MWTAAGAVLMGVTLGILVAAYFDGMAAIIVSTLASTEPRRRVRLSSLTQASLGYRCVASPDITSKSPCLGRSRIHGCPAHRCRLVVEDRCHTIALRRICIIKSSRCRPPRIVAGLPPLITDCGGFTSIRLSHVMQLGQPW